MKFIICGLPGTGKTTLAKKIQKEYTTYEYLSDFDILNKKTSTTLEPKSKTIINTILNNNHDDLVVDLEYSITPEEYTNSELNGKTKIIYLGFKSLDSETLFELFRSHDSNNNQIDLELKQKCQDYINKSIYFNSECEKYNLDFIDINKDRNTIINEIIVKYISENIK